MKIQSYSNEEYVQAKEDIVKKFRRELQDKILLKNGSFSKEKLIEICDIYGLYLDTFSGKDKKKYYSIVRKNENEEKSFLEEEK